MQFLHDLHAKYQPRPGQDPYLMLITTGFSTRAANPENRTVINCKCYKGF